jgi:cell division protein FtsW
MKKKPDHILLGTIAITLLVGIAALLSASIVESQKNSGEIYSYFIHQLVYGVGIGIVLGFIAYKVNYKKWRPLALPILLVSLFLLVLVFVPEISIESGGAKRWFAIYSFTFQPSEFAKLAFVIYLAAWLDARSKILKNWNASFVPFLIMISIFGGLIAFQPDLGTLGIISLTAAFMYLVAGANIAQMGTIAVLGIGTLVALLKIYPYKMDRITSFFDRSNDPLGISYQINQALLAIGSGGLLGVGLGKSIQKYAFLPEPMNDSIFAVWAEEAGFVGSIFLVCLFLLIAFRGLRIAKKSKDRFGKMVAFGITFWIISQAFVNIGAMIGLFPLTGIPLPLVSYGGSSMVVTLVGFGILLNISKYT